MLAAARLAPLPDVAEQARAWARCWGLPGFETRVTVEWSPRLRRALGRALPRERVVRLAARLIDGPRDVLLAVLCHELAHLAVTELHPHRCKPHGVEWQRLVRAAGFPPQPRFATAPSSSRRGGAPLLPDRYVHRCPVCQAQRMARRPVPRWRCAGCVAVGLPGRLEIRRIRAQARR